MAKKLLNLQSERLEEIPDDLQITLERRPDFLKKAFDKNSNQDYILTY
ncbi:MAG: hypothetical protein NZ516_11905 [Raineya sp.]|nr:hypothetical protein [Raineya sp.]